MNNGIKIKDKIGYALGDAGGLLTFSLVSAFLQMFYTDVLHIPLGKITVLMLVARIWDAVNDPMWGGFIDSRKPGRHGRFRPYILGASVPLATAAVLMFLHIPGLTENQYLIFAYVTYIFYGMMYTGTNIPYGALASVVTDDLYERSSLSMWRSIGAGIGGLPASMLLPLLVYSTSEAGVKYLDPTKLTSCVAVLAVISLGVFFAHFKLTKERITVSVKQRSQSYSFGKSFAALMKNRSFVVVSLASMLLIASQMYTQTVFNYLFKDYFAKPGLYIFVTVFTYLPMGILIIPMNKLIRRFGKKELCAAGMGFAAAVSFIMYFAGFTPLGKSPVFFLAMLFFSGAGQTFMVLEVWAMVMDVTDSHELVTKRKEEGTVYSVYNFIRKIGHTIAGSGSSLALMLIGYDVNAAQVGQSAEVVNGFYTLATLVPAIMYLLMFILLAFFYPLSKAKVDEMRAELEKAN